MATHPLTLALRDDAATAALGAALGQALQRLEAPIGRQGFTVYLEGELGAGKTTLVRGLLRHLGVTGAVKSPSYTLLEPYEVSRLHLYHFDFYRFKNPEEFTEGGFAEYFGPGSVCLVEWPAKALPHLPPADLILNLSVPESGRSAEVGANSEIGSACQDRLETFLREAPAGA